MDESTPIYHLAYTRRGGAGNAAWNICESQRVIGYNASFVSYSRGSITDSPLEHPSVTFAGLLDRHLVAQDSRDFISLWRAVAGRALRNLVLDGSILNLHWITGAISERVLGDILDSGVGIFWTMHDLRALTGACHYTKGCVGLNGTCSNCPQVRTPFRAQVRVGLEVKSRFFSQGRVDLIAPSSGFFNIATASSIGRQSRVHLIPYPIAPSEDLRLERSQRRFVFVAANVDEERKGLSLVLKWWEKRQNLDDSELVIVGANSERHSNPSLGIVGVGSKGAGELRGIYQSASYLLFGSFEDNAPGVVSEALSNGLEIVCFDDAMNDWLRLDGIPTIRPDELEGTLEGMHSEGQEARTHGARLFLDAREPSKVARRYIDVYTGSA